MKGDIVMRGVGSYKQYTVWEAIKRNGVWIKDGSGQAESYYQQCMSRNIPEVVVELYKISYDIPNVKQQL